MAFSAPAAYLTHQQKVLRLYKRALRHLESFCVHRWERGRGPAPGACGAGFPGEPGVSRTSGTQREGGPSAYRPGFEAPGPQFSVKNAAFRREAGRRLGETKESA